MPQTQECSVTVAFAELGRLERERAEFAAAKQTVREGLARQARELTSLRERFEAERPRAIARVRRERLRRERFRERVTARLIAEAESAHDERLALMRAELEAKRLRLTALEASTDAPRPSRRWLEWSIPVAATAMVAFLGFSLLDPEQAVAQTAAVEQPVEAESVRDEGKAPEAVTPELVAPAPEVVKPEVVAPAPEPTAEPSKKPAKKPSKKPSDKKDDEPKTEPKPVIKKNPKPLELGDFDGNPLG